MNPYMFVIIGVPLPDSRNYRIAEAAYIHIWVFDQSFENAKNRALKYILDQHWQPLKVEYEFEIIPEQIQNLEEHEAQLFQRAQRHGIAADFLAGAVEGLLDDDETLVGHP